MLLLARSVSWLCTFVVSLSCKRRKLRKWQWKLKQELVVECLLNLGGTRVSIILICLRAIGAVVYDSHECRA